MHAANCHEAAMSLSHAVRPSGHTHRTPAFNTRRQVLGLSCCPDWYQTLAVSGHALVLHRARCYQGTVDLPQLAYKRRLFTDSGLTCWSAAKCRLQSQITAQSAKHPEQRHHHCCPACQHDSLCRTMLPQCRLSHCTADHHPVCPGKDNAEVVMHVTASSQRHLPLACC